METNVGILAIGNEVVEGQITNRNASWLSEELVNLGAQPLFHLSCRDKADEIQASLNYLSQKCHLIIVSGGLGPTTDDCTRQCLSQWSNAPLILDEQQWKMIKDKLESRHLTIRDGHKNQAYIPQGATPLKNEKGVAPGFFLKTESCFLASLPGPPNELQHMFQTSLKPLIQDKIAPKSNSKLYTWVCLGAPESEIAHIVESLIGKKYEIGYRLHKPYVEVKIWASPQLSQEENKLFELLGEKLKPWFVTDTIANLRKKFHEKLQTFSKVFITDHLSSGLFLEKLNESARSNNIRYQCFEHDGYRFFSKDEVSTILSKMPIKEKEVMISLFPASDKSAYFSFGETIKLVELPRRITMQSKLGQLYVIESCFLEVVNQNG